MSFDEHVAKVRSLFAVLCAKTPLLYPAEAPSSPGIYLFLEKGIPERVGRSNNLKNRLRSHLRQDHNSGAYAFKRARQRFGTTATYKTGHGRKDLQLHPDFKLLFKEEIDRLRGLQVKWVVVEDDVDQYLLELYAALEFSLPLDEFGNH